MMIEPNTNRKTLKDRAKEFSVQLPFMEKRTKGEVKNLLDLTCTIVDYGFLHGDDGADYAVFAVKETPDFFYFGGAVLTDQLQQLEAEGYREEIVSEGLPMKLIEKKSKNGRTYVNVEFYPE